MRARSVSHEAVVDGASLREGVVDRLNDDGTVDVGLPGASPTDRMCCAVLVTGPAPPCLGPGDKVLVWSREGARGAGVVLGRIGPTHHLTPAEGAVDDDVPDELVLEAKQQLTLRVGDGSITLRADGKIQIKGKDLVSHAQRLNRIKGGAVSIN